MGWPFASCCVSGPISHVVKWVGNMKLTCSKVTVHEMRIMISKRSRPTRARVGRYREAVAPAAAVGQMGWPSEGPLRVSGLFVGPEVIPFGS